MAGEVWEFPELGSFVLLVVQRPAAEMLDDKARESGWQIWRAAGSFNMNGHAASL